MLCKDFLVLARPSCAADSRSCLVPPGKGKEADGQASDRHAPHSFRIALPRNAMGLLPTILAGQMMPKLGRVTHEPAEIQLHPRPPESSIQMRAALAALLLLAAMSR